MPKIDVTAAPQGSGSRYPAPYDEPCKKRSWQRLGEAAKLTHFGVNLVRLAPGAWSSQRHWHSHEDEFVYVLEGQVVLVTDADAEVLHAGDCAGFAAGVRDGHHFQNRSDTDAVLLVVGSRSDEDCCEYPDVDLRLGADHYRGALRFLHKDGRPY